MPETPRVLLVLGDAGLSTSMEESLRSSGFEPSSVGSSADALEAIPGGKFSAVVASQMLRGMDGVALCKKIKETRPELPVLLLAIVASSAGVNDVRKSSGAEAVFPRAFSAESFLQELKKRTGLDTSDTRAANAPPGRAAAARSSAERVSRAGVVEERVRANAPQAAPSASMTAMDPAWLFGQTVASRSTGALRLAVAAVERVIHFEGGRPLVATSNVPAERIGQILIARGVVAAAELERFLSLSAKSGVRLAELLVRQGVISATEQQALIGQQYVDRILAAFAWRTANIQFLAQPVPNEEIPIPLAPGRILSEGVRRHYDLARLQALFMPDRVLTRAPDAERLLPELGFDADETAGFMAIDGIQSIGVLAANERNREARLRAFHVGVCLRLIS